MKPIIAWAVVSSKSEELDSGFDVEKHVSQYFVYHDRSDAAEARKWWADSSGTPSRFWRLVRVEIRELPKKAKR